MDNLTWCWILQCSTVSIQIHCPKNLINLHIKLSLSWTELMQWCNGTCLARAYTVASTHLWLGFYMKILIFFEQCIELLSISLKPSCCYIINSYMYRIMENFLTDNSHLYHLFVPLLTLSITRKCLLFKILMICTHFFLFLPLVHLRFTAKKEIKCSRDSEILHEIVRNATVLYTKIGKSWTNSQSITNYFM